MKKVFISGSRRISRVGEDVTARIDRIIEQRLPIIIGDAPGVDRAIQDHLHRRGYDLVEVFCTGGACRNNRGGWPVRPITPPAGVRRGFAFYAAKDRAMADEAGFGLLLWDGESVGTLMNLKRLNDRRKKALLWVAREREFVDVTSEGDWQRVLSRCPPEVVARVRQEAGAERAASSAELPLTA